MIIVDSALKEREAAGRPVRVGIVGAGFIGRGVVHQIETAVPGMAVAAVANRTRAKAEEAYALAGRTAQCVSNAAALDEAISSGRPAVCEEAALLCEAEGIDVIVEATGEVEFGAEVALDAIGGGKHLVLVNAEVDALVGPLLKARADEAGVVLTGTDGDQPGVIMNLFRWVRATGYRPVLAGNVKGLLDHYRTPETQAGFAERTNQSVNMVTSFADGTKLAIEMAVVANATGFGASVRGMRGPACNHVDEATSLFSAGELLEAGGVVDYVLGANPGPGVFVLAYEGDAAKQAYMRYFKMGDGPLYAFYVPYHLPHLEAPLTAARAALFGDAAVAPLGAPVCEVVATAKRDLKPGEALDGMGGFMCYGLLENAGAARAENLLPIGLSDGCRLVRPVEKDAPLTFADVERPAERLCDRLWAEQKARFAAAHATAPPTRLAQ